MPPPENPIYLDEGAFYHLTDSYQLLHGRQVRPELLETGSGAIAKCFWQRKRWQRQNPASRFIRHSQLLNRLGISAPEVTEWYQCNELAVHMIIYQRLPGRDLRDLSGAGDTGPLKLFPAFLAGLHARGIYFRAIHLANVLYEEGRWALVDVADIQFKSGPLGIFHRARNLSHVFNVIEDQSALAAFGKPQLLDEYCRAADLHSWQHQLISLWIYLHRSS